MLHSLPLFHRISGQPVIVLGEGVEAEAKRRLVERVGGTVVGQENDRAKLAFVAIADPEDVTAHLKARGLLVNVVDRPELCDFTVPSILDRDPVLIAVGTGGASAGLAKALRLRLETLLPASLGALAKALSRARDRMRQRWPDPADRRVALDLALAERGPLDPLVSGNQGDVAAWLADDSAKPARFWAEIDLRSDDPDDLTLRELRWLGSADLVLHDPGVPAAILDRARADAERAVMKPGLGMIAHPGNVVILRRG